MALKVAVHSREQRLAAYQYVFNSIFEITNTNSVEEFLQQYRETDQVGCVVGCIVGWWVGDRPKEAPKADRHEQDTTIVLRLLC